MKNLVRTPSRITHPVMNYEPIPRSIYFADKALRSTPDKGHEIINWVQRHAGANIRENILDMDQRTLPLYLSEWHGTLAQYCGELYVQLCGSIPNQNKHAVNDIPQLAALNGVRRAVRRVRGTVLIERTELNNNRRIQRRLLSAVGTRALSD